MTSHPEPIVCSLCGCAASQGQQPGQASPPPLGWMGEHDPRRGTRWVCAACARDHVRAIEARLDDEWW